MKKIVSTVKYLPSFNETFSTTIVSKTHFIIKKEFIPGLWIYDCVVITLSIHDSIKNLRDASLEFIFNGEKKRIITSLHVMRIPHFPRTLDLIFTIVAQKKIDIHIQWRLETEEQRKNNKKEIVCNNEDETILNTSGPTFEFRSINKPYMEIDITRHMRYVWGKQSVRYGDSECVLICLVRNGYQYIRDFIAHYKKIGIKHFFFIDNESTDNTVELLKTYRDTSIISTSLPFKEYECDIRRSVIIEQCKNRWCLSVDIDEFFDFPFSNRIGLSQLIGYLRRARFTAFVAYMLDMFSLDPVRKSEVNSDIYFDSGDYNYYDLDSITKQPYPLYFNECNKNSVFDRNIQHYCGGIRKRLFGNSSDFFLIKHPLLFIDNSIVPFTHPHFSNNVRIADVSGVLKHYKLISSFFSKVKSVVREKNYPYYAQREYQMYYDYFLSRSNLIIQPDNPRKWRSVNDLLDNKFIYASEKFKQYIHSLVSLHKKL